MLCSTRAAKGGRKRIYRVRDGNIRNIQRSHRACIYIAETKKRRNKRNEAAAVETRARGKKARGSDDLSRSSSPGSVLLCRLLYTVAAKNVFGDVNATLSARQIPRIALAQLPAVSQGKMKEREE